MDRNNNSFSNYDLNRNSGDQLMAATPLSGQISAPTQTKPKKKMVILGVGAAILVTVAVVATVAIVSSNTNGEVDGNLPTVKTTYLKDDSYGAVLNTLLNLSDGMLVEQIPEILVASGADESYLQLNKRSDIASNEETEESEFNTSDGVESYIAAVPIEPGQDYSDQNIEYISFNYSTDEEGEPTQTIENITYHSYHNGEHDIILMTGDGEYTHINGDYANSFNNIFDAVEDYKMRL